MTQLYNGKTLDELEALANAATEGPWTRNSRGELCHPAWIMYHDKERAKIEHAGSVGALYWASDDGDKDVEFRGGEKDEAFIAVSRAAIPALIARIGELEYGNELLIARCKELEGELEILRKENGP